MHTHTQKFAQCTAFPTDIIFRRLSKMFGRICQTLVTFARQDIGRQLRNNISPPHFRR
eukprot:TRINITY_DN526_c0_g1_i1.p3 TRINITY_DN526_c0_g1~~TRINITY_DN526_c0_g1_i1.p3  ORF type:complete len:58 (+),score=3.16 TRINITY_DN526_c0_g1_i1:269-442(+)